MDLIGFATGTWGAPLMKIAGRLLPRSLSYGLCRWAAGRLATHQSHPFVNALRVNMAVVHRVEADDPQLDGIVNKLLRHALCSYVDLFKMASAKEEAYIGACEVDPASQRLIQECRSSGRGLLLVGAHMCSFDMLLLRLKDSFSAVQLLSKANPESCNQMMNNLRRDRGMHITPISMGSLREAIRTLRSGGVVAMAADLPAEDGEPLTFFGRRTNMLIGHARLAVKTGARMVVGTSVRVGNGKYRARLTVVPQPRVTGDRERDMVNWAQASLLALERLIQDAPDQWFMPQPIWTASAPA